MGNNLTKEVLDSLEQYQRDLFEWRALNDQGTQCSDWSREKELREKLTAHVVRFWDLGINMY